MAIKRKLVTITLVIFAISLGALAAYYFARKYNGKVFAEWLAAYNDGDDARADVLANRLWLVDPQARAVYLAQTAVSDSIHLRGQTKIERLSEALKRLENAWFHFPGANERAVFTIKASLAALEGNNTRAEKYAKMACKLMTIKHVTFEDCLSGHYSFGDPNGSRLAAVQLYEDATLYSAIGAGDKTGAKFYEAVALKYFDLGQAHRIIDALTREGRFSDEMKKTYCNPASPPDTAACGAR